MATINHTSTASERPRFIETHPCTVSMGMGCSLITLLAGSVMPLAGVYRTIGLATAGLGVYGSIVAVGLGLSPSDSLSARKIVRLAVGGIISVGVSFAAGFLDSFSSEASCEGSCVAAAFTMTGGLMVGLGTAFAEHLYKKPLNSI